MNHMTAIRMILAVLVTIGTFSVIGLMIMYPERFKDTQALLLMVGTLSAAFGALMQWAFGSSSGSDRKTELLARAPAIASEK